MSKWEKEKLDFLINEKNTSYEEIGRMYGVTCQAVRKAAKRLGVDMKPRRAINPSEELHRKKSTKKQYCINCGAEIISKHKQKYCSNKCQGEYQRKIKYEYYLKNQDEFVGKEITYQWLKKIILEEQNHRCDICNIEDSWNDKELHFILDHIDGDATNNKRENLRLICPNCDSQLDTYKSRNIGKSTRKYKPYKI